MDTQTPLSAILFTSLFTSAAALSISSPAIADHEHRAKLLDDKQAPTVLYSPSASTADEKQFTVTVKDNAGIQSVTLFYRKPGSSQFMTTRMKRVGESSSYIADLGKRDLDEKLNFNILAVDLAGNSQLVGGNSASPINTAQTTASADGDL